MRTNAAKEARKLRRRVARYPAWEHVPKRSQRAMRKRARRWHKQQNHRRLRGMHGHYCTIMAAAGSLALTFRRFLHSPARRDMEQGRPAKS